MIFKYNLSLIYNFKKSNNIQKPSNNKSLYKL